MILRSMPIARPPASLPRDLSKSTRRFRCFSSTFQTNCSPHFGGNSTPPCSHPCPHPCREADMNPSPACQLTLSVPSPSSFSAFPLHCSSSLVHSNPVVPWAPPSYRTGKSSFTLRALDLRHRPRVQTNPGRVRKPRLLQLHFPCSAALRRVLASASKQQGCDRCSEGLWMVRRWCLRCNATRGEHGEIEALDSGVQPIQ